MLTELEILQKQVALMQSQIEALQKSLPVKQWFSLEEFCEFTGYEKSTAYKLSSNYAITTTKAGGLKFKVSDTIRYMNSLQRKSEHELMNAA